MDQHAPLVGVRLDGLSADLTAYLRQRSSRERPNEGKRRQRSGPAPAKCELSVTDVPADLISKLVQKSATAIVKMHLVFGRRIGGGQHLVGPGCSGHEGAALMLILQPVPFYAFWCSSDAADACHRPPLLSAVTREVGAWDSPQPGDPRSGGTSPSPGQKGIVLAAAQSVFDLGRGSHKAACTS